MYETTKSRIVTGPVAIWAIPKKEYNLKIHEYELTGGWDYELHTSDPYEVGAIKLQEFPVTLTLSEGLPFIEKAIDTLEDKVTAEMANHERKINKLRGQIQQLKLITHQEEATI